MTPGEELMAEASVVLSQAHGLTALEVGENGEPCVAVGADGAAVVGVGGAASGRDRPRAGSRRGGPGGGGPPDECRVLLRKGRRPEPRREPIPAEAAAIAPGPPERKQEGQVNDFHIVAE